MSSTEVQRTAQHLDLESRDVASGGRLESVEGVIAPGNRTVPIAIEIGGRTIATAIVVVDGHAHVLARLVGAVQDGDAEASHAFSLGAPPRTGPIKTSHSINHPSTPQPNPAQPKTGASPQTTRAEARSNLRSQSSKSSRSEIKVPVRKVYRGLDRYLPRKLGDLGLTTIIPAPRRRLPASLRAALWLGPRPNHSITAMAALLLAAERLTIYWSEAEGQGRACELASRIT